ncbi:hypothetical protein [Scandinavium lactucae]|uniref:Uncharacterized protein n=1 Tax=Scandinavium lactucae TaxID=3095028 RepID=A0ABU4QPG7_9ENTR|nr:MULTISPECIES: hypothetical protein [unclassified Scandinavium]MDX6040133.1 hypothetical protein [Scandinavium sp. V105_6]MDX6048673.1 hypothetical protein [Scandinavium sp. V105_1]
MTDKKIEETVSNVSETGNDAEVWFFTDINFHGDCQTWSKDSFDHLDFEWDNGMNFYQTISSLLVIRGECQVSSDKSHTFYDSGYFDADKGKNGSGIFDNLMDYGWNDRITTIRTQHGEILRNKSTPYLVLRNTDHKNAKIIEADNPNIGAYPTQLVFCIGSPTGKVYLYSGENYTGEIMTCSVDGGYVAHGSSNGGVYWLDDSPFTVRSVSFEAITPPGGLDLYADPGFSGTKTHLDWDTDQLTPNTSSIIVGGGTWYGYTTEYSHQSSAAIILEAGGGYNNDGRYDMDYLNEKGVSDKLRSFRLIN